MLRPPAANPGTNMSEQSPPSFESQLARLEQLVKQLESGDVSLEQSMKVFEEGVQLTREAQELLSKLEQKILILADQDGGEVAVEPTTDET